MPFRDKINGREYNTRIGYAIDTVVGSFWQSAKEEYREGGILSLPVSLGVGCMMPFFLLTEYTSALSGIMLERIPEPEQKQSMDLIDG